MHRLAHLHDCDFCNKNSLTTHFCLCLSCLLLFLSLLLLPHAHVHEHSFNYCFTSDNLLEAFISVFWCIQTRTNAQNTHHPIYIPIHTHKPIILLVRTNRPTDQPTVYPTERLFLCFGPVKYQTNVSRSSFIFERSANNNRKGSKTFGRSTFFRSNFLGRRPTETTKWKHFIL